MTAWPSTAIVDHLWQSTVFVALVWLATLALRQNRARVRCWLWVAASVKFLIPVSALVGLGARFEWRAAPAIAQPAAAFVMDDVLALPMLASVVAAPGARETSIVPWVLGGFWMAGFAVVLFRWWREWTPIRAALRASMPLSLDAAYDTTGLRVMAAPSWYEPAIIGIWRPVLLVPVGLVDRLTPPQLHALIAHERCHVRCHDNLFAAVHMLVEAAFWFHPLVWWIERRLIDERERACDEAVLHAGTHPADYAQGILTVCRWSIGSPVACVAGVTGSDLHGRIEAIMANRVGRRLAWTARLLLAGAATIALVGPIGLGILGASATAQSQAEPRLRFEVASIRRNSSGSQEKRFDGSGGRFFASNVTLRMLISQAYDVQNFQMAGSPDWVDSEHYDVDARSAEATVLPRRRLMVQALLEDRFKLKVRREMRTVPVYVLTVAKNGPTLTRGTCLTRDPNTPAPVGPKVSELCGFMGFGGTPGGARTLRATGIETGLLASALMMELQRHVIDETGVTGAFNVVLRWTPDTAPVSLDGSAPSLFTALQEQLGLRLESARRPAEILVIDSVERPSEN